MKNQDMPAFPVFNEEGDTIVDDHSFLTGAAGLTKLEWFTGLAMQGCMANSGFSKKMDVSGVSGVALDTAKALLEELEK